MDLSKWIVQNLSRFKKSCRNFQFILIVCLKLSLLALDCPTIHLHKAALPALDRSWLSPGQASDNLILTVSLVFYLPCQKVVPWGKVPTLTATNQFWDKRFCLSYSVVPFLCKNQIDFYLMKNFQEEFHWSVRLQQQLLHILREDRPIEGIIAETAPDEEGTAASKRFT